MADSSRLEDLRRRVQKDPASIAFAQLAEECRRAGNNEEAVAICHAGLQRHPGYLSARVTLARALTDLNRLDEAQAEFERVLRGAPENLAAVRGLAEIHRRRGALGEALEPDRTALTLARNDPALEQKVSALAPETTRRDQPSAPPPVVSTAFAPAAEADPLPSSGLAEPAPRPPLPPSDASAGRAARTIAALEQWLDAVHVARAHRGT